MIPDGSTASWRSLARVLWLDVKHATERRPMINPVSDNRASQLEAEATESILFSSARRVRIATERAAASTEMDRSHRSARRQGWGNPTNKLLDVYRLRGKDGCDHSSNRTRSSCGT